MCLVIVRVAEIGGQLINHQATGKKFKVIGQDFSILNVEVKPGTRAIVQMPMPKLSSHTKVDMPVHVVHGKRDGPVLFISAAIHGDELNGIEIVRRVLAMKSLSKLKGTLVAVPIVNAYGLIHESRYLPDRRDLNRSFPGSDAGSLAARLANVFMQDIVMLCTHGIDLHTGSNHRTNLPQIRANIDDPETSRLAHSFGVPVLINSSLRDGSLRAAAGELGIPMLLYEAGEALRFDEVSIRAGVVGITNVMRALDMLPPTSASKKSQPQPFVARSSSWTRTPESGMLRLDVLLGARVKKGDILGFVDDPNSGFICSIQAANNGIVIGRLELPIVHEGDAVYHIARFRDDMSDVVDRVESFQLDHEDELIN